MNGIVVDNLGRCRYIVGVALKGRLPSTPRHIDQQTGADYNSNIFLLIIGSGSERYVLYVCRKVLSAISRNPYA